MKIFVSPHNDDETLWGAFTLLRESPLVVVVFDGHIQASRGIQVTWKERREETEAACQILGVSVGFLGFRDDDRAVIPETILGRMGQFDEAYIPALEVGGHAQHNLVAAAFEGKANVKRYLTYTVAGKSRSENEVPILRSEWIDVKHRAMACYRSQMNLDPRMGCHHHFLNDIREYYSSV